MADLGARRKMIDATIAAIDTGGEDAVRVQAVADAAGVQIPVLYRQFGSRGGLLHAAHVERLSRALAADLAGVRAAFDTVTNRDEMIATFDGILQWLMLPERIAGRWQRINILGSTYQRPELAAAIAELQGRALTGIADALRHPADAGWLRPGLDVDAFAAWFAGQTLGRLLIETGATPIDGAAWNAISADAVRHVLFG
jgi:AcrR family transcriptional regulator